MRPAAVAAADRVSSRGLQTQYATSEPVSVPSAPSANATRVGRSGDGPGGAEPVAAAGSSAPPAAEIRLSATARGSAWLETAAYSG